MPYITGAVQLFNILGLTGNILINIQIGYKLLLCSHQSVVIGEKSSGESQKSEIALLLHF